MLILSTSESAFSIWAHKGPAWPEAAHLMIHLLAPVEEYDTPDIHDCNHEHGKYQGHCPPAVQPE